MFERYFLGVSCVIGPVEINIIFYKFHFANRISL